MWKLRLLGCLHTLQSADSSQLLLSPVSLSFPPFWYLESSPGQQANSATGVTLVLYSVDPKSSCLTLKVVSNLLCSFVAAMVGGQVQQQLIHCNWKQKPANHMIVQSVNCLL